MTVLLLASFALLPWEWAAPVVAVLLLGNAGVCVVAVRRARRAPVHILRSFVGLFAIAAGDHQPVVLATWRTQPQLRIVKEGIRGDSAISQTPPEAILRARCADELVWTIVTPWAPGIRDTFDLHLPDGAVQRVQRDDNNRTFIPLDAAWVPNQRDQRTLVMLWYLQGPLRSQLWV